MRVSLLSVLAVATICALAVALVAAADPTVPFLRVAVRAGAAFVLGGLAGAVLATVLRIVKSKRRDERRKRWGSESASS